MKRFSATARAAAWAAALLLSRVPLPAQTPDSAITRVPIGTIQIRGNHRVPEASILSGLGFQAGDSILGPALSRAIHRLYASGQFENVEVRALADSTNPGAPVTLQVLVSERPLVTEVEFRGLEHVKGSVVRDTVGLRTGDPYNPAKVTAAEGMTRSLLAQKGYQVRKIEHRLEPLPDQPSYVSREGGTDTVMTKMVRLIFDVEEGQRVAVSDIDFVGNEVFPDDELRSVLGTKREGFLWLRTGSYDEDRLREDLRQKLPDFYKSSGYIDFAVAGDSLAVDPITGKGRLVIEVQEGPQYLLSSFDIRGSRQFSSDELRRLFEERRTGLLSGFGLGKSARADTGEVFDAVAFRDASEQAQRLYANNGYLYAQVNPVVERIPADSSGRPQVRASWEIQEGRVATVGLVEVRGNTFTHENIIRNQLLLLPGDVYSEDRLLQSYRRISGLGFFETPVPLPQMTPDPNTGEVSITFEVKEKQTGSVNFGTAIGGYGGLSGFLGYDQPNLFGLAKTGHLRWEFGRYSNNFEASYSDPSIRGSWVSGSLSLFSSRDRFFSFSEGRRRRTGAGLRFGLPMPGDRFTRLNMGYSLSRTIYEQFEDAASIFSLPPGVQSTVTLGISRNNLDHPLFPTAGTNQELSADLSGGLLGGDGAFQKYTLSGQWFVPVGNLGGGQPGSRPVRFTLGMSLEAGAIFGDASRFPFDRFWMGGVQFGRPLRGYEETTITPNGYYPRCTYGSAGCNLQLQDRLGDAYLRLSAEYDMRLNDNISLGLFYDAGNVWQGPSQINPTRLLRGAGIGVMLVTPFGPLGLDYAYGFDKDVPGWQLHFKFGQGF